MNKLSLIYVNRFLKTEFLKVKNLSKNIQTSSKYASLPPILNEN